MKERIDNYIQCPKCLKRLILKKERWNTTPYCKHCDVEYDIVLYSEEMKFTITEK